MVQVLILKEVNAVSICGTTIVVEQVFEKIILKDSINVNWIPLPKIVIANKVIDLNESNSFIHPKTKKVFQVVMEGDMFKAEKKIRHI